MSFFCRAVRFQAFLILLFLPFTSSFIFPWHRKFPRATFYATPSSIDEIFIFSFDGALAHTSPWKSSMGIEVALEIWPFLKDEEPYKSLHGHGQDWLLNKMVALSHVLQSDQNAMMGCDHVLLARMLLEEQVLDQGRSDGSMGKYGSQFHPRQSIFRSHNSQGSRPLTVGEISANWIEGASLRDTIRAKYHIDRKDPLPMIQKNIRKFLKEKVSDWLIHLESTMFLWHLLYCKNYLILLKSEAP
jgi:hypothetical protein